MTHAPVKLINTKPIPAVKLWLVFRGYEAGEEAESIWSKLSLQVQTAWSYMDRNGQYLLRRSDVLNGLPNIEYEFARCLYDEYVSRLRSLELPYAFLEFDAAGVNVRQGMLRVAKQIISDRP